jgi:aminoglycoside phosphotransferase (APT) family kinase protein
MLEVGENSPHRLFLRRDLGGGPTVGTPFTLAREAELVGHLAELGLPVARIIGADADLGVSLAEVLPGRSDFDSLEWEDRQRVADDFMAILVRTHRMDPSSLAEVVGETRSLPYHIGVHIDRWQRALEAVVEQVDPLLLAAFVWLRSSIPIGGDTVLVHGDPGPGNFLF